MVDPEQQPFVPASEEHQHVIFGKDNADFATKAMLHHNDLVQVVRDIISDTRDARWTDAMRLNVIRTRAVWAVWRIEGGERPNEPEASNP